MSIMSLMVRAMFESGDNKRDEGLTTPEDVERSDDISYGPDGRWQRLDLYRPRNVTGPLPVIVSVHGGGWVYGDKERYQFYCMELARRGFAVVNFTYRLAPKHKFPAPLEDTVLAFRWTMENAGTYGLDKSHVFAVGDSAGGHLLALYCAAYSDPDYAAALGIPGPLPVLPEAVALHCGAYRFGGDGMLRRLLRDLMPRGGTAKERALIAPLPHITAAFPPAYIMTASGDFLKQDSLAMHRRLEELGVENVFRLYEKDEGTLGHVFHLNIRSPEAEACNDDQCAFFRGFIKR